MLKVNEIIWIEVLFEKGDSFVMKLKCFQIVSKKARINSHLNAAKIIKLKIQLPQKGKKNKRMMENVLFWSMKHHYFQNSEAHYRWSQCTRGIQKLHQCRRDSFEKHVCKLDVQIWGGKREQNRKTTLIRLINLTLVNFIQLYNYTIIQQLFSLTSFHKNGNIIWIWWILLKMNY